MSANQRANKRQRRLFFEQGFELFSGLGSFICWPRRGSTLLQSKIITEISPVLHRNALGLRFLALICKGLVVVGAIQATIQIRAAPRTCVVSENLFLVFQLLTAMMAESFFHEQPLASSGVRGICCTPEYASPVVPVVAR
jgi:hypothetical protein